MEQKLDIVYLDGTIKTVEALFCDFIAYEMAWNRSVIKIETETRLADLGWLAWHTEIRKHATALQFDPDWVQLVRSVKIADETPDIPLETTQPTE